MTISPKEMDQDDDYHPRNMVYSKMEKIVQEMQDVETGVPVKCHKLFLSTVPAVFTGYDLVEWLMERLNIEESTELLHLASLLCQSGYFFPVTDNKSLVVKDDGSLYRFQSPYFWPSQNWQSDSVDYAIYLAKRTMRNKQRHGLEEHEQAAFNKLKKLLCDKWDFVFMQAEEQVRLGKERKKADKAVFDSQERAFWRVHRPSSGPSLHGEQDICRQYNLRRSFQHKKATIEAYVKEIHFCKLCLSRTRMKVSKVVESLIHHCQQYEELDPFLFPALPSNPWISDDVSMWMLNTVLVDTPTERRVKRWSFSLEELLADATGRHEFQMFLEKEYSSENLHFWNAVEELKGLPHSQVPSRVHNIYQQYLGPGAQHEINIDGKTMEETVEAMKSPSRFTFDKAQAHIFLLMKKDSYQRFLRSNEYKTLLANAVIPSTKKKFFAFGTKKKSPNPSPKSKRRGSASSMVTTEHCLAANTLTQHSYSTGNLQELETTRSSKSSPSECTIEEQKTSNHRSLSPSSFMKKLNDLVRSENTRSNLEVPSHPAQFNVDTQQSDDGGGGSSESDEPAGTSIGLNIAVPNTKHNVVAPWEEEEDI